MNIIHSTSNNVTPPIAPKWKTSETLLDDFHASLSDHVREYLMVPCVTSPQER